MLKIYTITVTPFAQNARVLVDTSTSSAVVVDPGGDIDLICECISPDVTVSAIFLTHAHIDHAGGVEGLRRRLGKEKVRLFAHRADAEMRAHIGQQALIFGLNTNEYENVSEPDEYIDDGDKFSLGTIEAKILFTPGHAPGHVCLFFERQNFEEISDSGTLSRTSPVLIGGDTLFAGSIGRTDLPGGNYHTLISSIAKKILTLPDDTLVLSGHGPNTTVGHERVTNPFLVSAGEFV